MLRFLKAAQLSVSLGVIFLFWLIYPGTMVVFASAIGMIYVAASIGAILDNRKGIWLGFIFTTITAALSTLGLYLRNGFDFIEGKFDQQGGFYLPPCLFLAISLVSISVVILHLVSWRWMVSAHRKDAN